MANEVLKLGYDAGLTILARQDSALANVRNRATAIFSATTVATTLSAAVGLLNTDPAKGAVVPGWASATLLAIVVLIGVTSLYALWPIRGWIYGPGSEIFVTPAVVAMDEDGYRSRAIPHLNTAIASNQRHLDRRASVLQISILLLLVELVFTTVVLTLL